MTLTLKLSLGIRRYRFTESNNGIFIYIGIAFTEPKLCLWNLQNTIYSTKSPKAWFTYSMPALSLFTTVSAYIFYKWFDWTIKRQQPVNIPQVYMWTGLIDTMHSPDNNKIFIQINTYSLYVHSSRFKFIQTEIKTNCLPRNISSYQIKTVKSFVKKWRTSH